MSQAIKVTLDDSGNILLPASLRDRLHLTPGMTFVVEQDERGGVRLRVQAQPTVLAEKEGILVAKVTASGDLSDVVRHERERRVFDLVQRAGL